MALIDECERPWCSLVATHPTGPSFSGQASRPEPKARRLPLGEEAARAQSINAVDRLTWVPLSATAHPVHKMLLGQSQADV